MSPRAHAALFVGFYLIASVASACADCAWVLWVQHHDRQGNSPGFDIAATYTNATECITKVDQMEQSFRALSTRMFRDARTTLSVLFREKDGSYGRGIDWICTPDTVDPRGAK